MLLSRTEMKDPYINHLISENLITLKATTVTINLHQDFNHAA